MGLVTLVFSQPDALSNVAMLLLDVFPILTGLDCGYLADPANGQVHISAPTYGHTATYSCNTCYNLVGDSTRFCSIIGEWSGSAPTCQSRTTEPSHFFHMCIYKSNITISVCILNWGKSERAPQ